MSTRSSIYYDEDSGVHVYFQLADCEYYLDYSFGPFSVRIPLTKEFAEALSRGLRTK